MKKLLAMLLALVMVCSLATVVFAADEYSDMEKVVIKKNYTNPNNGVSPAETFKFEIELKNVTDAGVEYKESEQALPEVASVEYDEGDAGKVIVAPPNVDYKCIKDIVVTLPEYKAVGIYTYEIKETAGDMAGVTYHADPIKLVVTVIEQDGKVRVAAVHTENAGEEKDDMITNVYESGKLSVSKTVTGNLGDQEKEFTMTVKFKAPEGKTVGAPITYTDGIEQKTIETTAWVNGIATAEITLKHGETVTFNNIPYGVTYAVIENSYTDDGYDAAKYVYGNTADPDGSNTINFDPIKMPFVQNLDNKIDDAEDAVEVINNKDTEVDTGIALDSAPYILILAVAMGGLVLFTTKKRVQE